MHGIADRRDAPVPDGSDIGQPIRPVIARRVGNSGGSEPDNNPGRRGAVFIENAAGNIQTRRWSGKYTPQEYRL
jgi:hypothetical protein